MSGFPGSPRLIKGAIIGLDPLNPLASVVVFQYNPETMTRRLEALHQLAAHSICVPCEYVQPHHVQHSGQAALAI